MFGLIRHIISTVMKGLQTRQYRICSIVTTILITILLYTLVTGIDDNSVGDQAVEIELQSRVDSIISAFHHVHLPTYVSSFKTGKTSQLTCIHLQLWTLQGVENNIFDCTPCLVNSRARSRPVLQIPDFLDAS